VVHFTSHEGLTANRVPTGIKSVLRRMRRYAGAGDLWRVSSNTQRQKQKPQIAPGPLLSKVDPSLERNVSICCRFSE
jgi:hypothetical protein